MTDSSKRPIAVFDIDNTLADTAHRQRFLERRPRDWDAFFAAAPHDPPLAEGIALAVATAEECEIVYLTGRPDRCRRDTLDWLAAHGLPEGRVHMRRNADAGLPGTPSWRSCAASRNGVRSASWSMTTSWSATTPNGPGSPWCGPAGPTARPRWSRPRRGRGGPEPARHGSRGPQPSSSMRKPTFRPTW